MTTVTRRATTATMTSGDEGDGEHGGLLRVVAGSAGQLETAPGRRGVAPAQRPGLTNLGLFLDLRGAGRGQRGSGGDGCDVRRFVAGHQRGPAEVGEPGGEPRRETKPRCRTCAGRSGCGPGQGCAGQPARPGAARDPGRGPAARCRPDLVPGLVVALDADAGQVLPVVVEHDQRLPTERAQPTGQPGRGGVDPHAGVRHVGRCLGPAERDPFDGVPGLAEDARQQRPASPTRPGPDRGRAARRPKEARRPRCGRPGRRCRSGSCPAAVPAGLRVAGAGDDRSSSAAGSPRPAGQMLPQQRRHRGGCDSLAVVGRWHGHTAGWCRSASAVRRAGRARAGVRRSIEAACGGRVWRRICTWVIGGSFRILPAASPAAAADTKDARQRRRRARTGEMTGVSAPDEARDATAKRTSLAANARPQLRVGTTRRGHSHAPDTGGSSARTLVTPDDARGRCPRAVALRTGRQRGPQP